MVRKLVNNSQQEWGSEGYMGLHTNMVAPAVLHLGRTFVCKICALNKEVSSGDEASRPARKTWQLLAEIPMQGTNSARYM